MIGKGAVFAVIRRGDSSFHACVVMVGSPARGVGDVGGDGGRGRGDDDDDDDEWDDE